MKKFGRIRVSISPLRKEASDASEMVSQLLFGEVVEVLEQKSPWMSVKVISDNYLGFLDEKHLELLDEESYFLWTKEPKFRLQSKFTHLSTPEGFVTIGKGSLICESDCRKYKIDEIYTSTLALSQLVKDYLNTPYLWGGRSIFGIDCSGLTQICTQIIGKEISRDASTQVNEGIEIAFNDRQAGDFAFFVNDKQKVIHVGILTSPDSIVHASGWVREDKFDEKGIFKAENQSYSHKFFTLRRIL